MAWRASNQKVNPPIRPLSSIFKPPFSSTMDALIAQIAQLRISAENTAQIAEEVVAAAAAAAAAAPVGAGLPPTAGAQGPMRLPFPPPPLGEPELTLGVATPATFDDAEANASHYMLGKDLYAPSAADYADLEAAENAAFMAANTTLKAPARSMYKKSAKAAEKAAWDEVRPLRQRINAQQRLAERFDEYNKGAVAQAGKVSPGSYSKDLHLIYRFYVFRVGRPGTDIHMPCALEPVGLLNPHAYIGWKRSGEGGWGKDLLNFVDASQPAPAVPTTAAAWPWAWA